MLGWTVWRFVGLWAVSALIALTPGNLPAAETPAAPVEQPRTRAQEILSTLNLRFNPEALRRAIHDLASSYPQSYTNGAAFLKQLDEYEKKLPALVGALKSADAAQGPAAFQSWDEMLAFQRNVMLANPLLDFDKILFIQHQVPKDEKNNIAAKWEDWGIIWRSTLNLTKNWASDLNAVPVMPCWDDAIAQSSIHHPEQPDTVVYKAKASHCIQNLDLNFDADKMLFNMAGSNNCWQVHEIKPDGTGLRQVNLGREPDVNNGDACYLPDGRIIFNSDRAFVGVPCEDGWTVVSGLCQMKADGSSERMLTFDQESNFHPSILNNGRVLYMRYEYANVAHQFPGLLFHMNPDGSEQMEYYGSNSYWPNRIFYPRAIPEHPTMVVGIVTGHHAPCRAGKIVLFDPARGRSQASGAIQTIPGYGKKVEPVIEDNLYGKDWPKFTNPYPLSDKYFLVSAKLSVFSAFSIWLVDIFDNMTLLKEVPGHALFDPTPFKKVARPPTVPDKVKVGQKKAFVYVQDVYRGHPMGGVPRGTVKRLRLYSYNYMYRSFYKAKMGHNISPGMDGPWEPRYILGTVPVNEDGSAYFSVPANTPIAVQPLDKEGRALQVMRSWFSGMPGEFVSCVGCHDSQNQVPMAKPSLALKQEPFEIEPWKGPARGFDYEREIQPVLDRYCVGCHDASAKNGIDLSRKTMEEKISFNQKYAASVKTTFIEKIIYTPSYLMLQSRVYRPNADSDYRPQVALEFFADKSPLVRMLKKGHHHVTLDPESWERMYTWIDLAAPDHGSWTRFAPDWKDSLNALLCRRQAMLKTYANVDYDYEKLPPLDDKPVSFVPPVAPSPASPAVSCSDWPFSAETARKRQAGAGLPATCSLSLDNGLKIDFVLIPRGEYIMGDPKGADDEHPVAKVSIERPFYMSVREISNAEYRTLFPKHDSGFIGSYGMDFRHKGYNVNADQQPVVRVSWEQALGFAKALSAKTGNVLSLPTEAQWEWACRAGSRTDMWYGDRTTVFSMFENLADVTTAGFFYRLKVNWILKDENSDDKGLISVAPGTYQPNPWGLCDMHGNVCEWTLSEYQPYPYQDGDGRNAATGGGLKVVRGGSWWDRPAEATSAYRWRYHAWEKAYNVGFRLVLGTDQ